MPRRTRSRRRSIGVQVIRQTGGSHAPTAQERRQCNRYRPHYFDRPRWNDDAVLPSSLARGENLAAGLLRPIFGESAGADRRRAHRPRNIASTQSGSQTNPVKSFSQHSDSLSIHARRGQIRFRRLSVRPLKPGASLSEGCENRRAKLKRFSPRSPIPMV